MKNVHNKGVGLLEICGQSWEKHCHTPVKFKKREKYKSIKKKIQCLLDSLIVKKKNK